MGREVGHVNLIVPGITRTDAELGYIESHRHIGYAVPLSDTVGDYRRALPLSKNPGITGLINRAWRLDFVAGAPRAWHIDYIQIARGAHLVLAVEYPPNTSFNVIVQRQWAWPQAINYTVEQASSIDEILGPETLRSHEEIACPRPAGNPSFYFCNDTGATGTKWFFDGRMLYLRLVDLRYYVSDYTRQPFHGFTRAGVALPGITNFYRLQTLNG